MNTSSLQEAVSKRKLPGTLRVERKDEELDRDGNIEGQVMHRGKSTSEVMGEGEEVTHSGNLKTFTP
jgi:hypothetical protein